MNDFRQRLIHLHSCQSLTRNMMCRILYQDHELETIYDHTTKTWQNLFGLSKDTAQSLHQHLHSYSSIQILEYLKQKLIHVITIEDTDYPPLLKNIFDPPFVLYAIGQKAVLNNEKRIAVIGTRTPTDTGLQTLSTLIPPITRQGWTIVSGMAKGIDSHAHWQALKAQGQTIAILGSGFNYIYPKSNQELFSKLTQKNIILSEYPPNTPPKKWHFPARNRIISGLSKAVLVVEAKERSGSLITADQALEQGRDVFAVPGSIFSNESKGTNYLIQQGAKLVASHEDILCEIDN
ncbi:DNA-processing protein DprA [Halalkalibacter krulwichiae]|uniref:Smf/DprA SLOG domain-containing protein n=1 Tax=Halalkalibacter krulwichiae TaxID=199441 RepID=A0A1X9MK64_9BACI|nr:DNA-processing protein DprA [Halalkalibacter krulwichiae]ARK31012.1 hypothetical protein BkAM31D_14825 [Halalkalibacter krulwichiae]